MARNERIYILGAGAIGLALAAHLIRAGKNAIAVRTSNSEMSATVVDVTVQGHGDNAIKAAVEMISLSKLKTLDGIIVVTAKSYANERIAAQMKEKGTEAPIVVMQNGIGVETPFLQAGFPEIYRCVLFATSQKTGPYEISFRAITTSPIGIIRGQEHLLKMCVDQLSTPDFSFYFEDNIQREIWKKGIINAVFNTICPLLEVDNGIFIRDEQAAGLASEIIEECLQVTRALGLKLEQTELMERLLKISEGSQGQFISTLQDIRNRRQTEIGDLNLEIARIAEAMSPKIEVNSTKLLGTLTLLKSELRQNGQPGID